MISRAEYLWWTICLGRIVRLLVIKARSHSVLACKVPYVARALPALYCDSALLQRRTQLSPVPSLFDLSCTCFKGHILCRVLSPYLIPISVWRYRYAPTHTVLSLSTCGEGTVLIRGLFAPDISHLSKDDSYCIGRLFASSSPLY